MGLSHKLSSIVFRTLCHYIQSVQLISFAITFMSMKNLPGLSAQKSNMCDYIDFLLQTVLPITYIHGVFNCRKIIILWNYEGMLSFWNGQHPSNIKHHALLICKLPFFIPWYRIYTYVCLLASIWETAALYKICRHIGRRTLGWECVADIHLLLASYCLVKWPTSVKKCTFYYQT